MARLAAEAKAGYYPAPTSIVRQIAALVIPQAGAAPRQYHFDRGSHHCVLDPCCGEGEALATLCEAWFGERASAPADVYACELERGRHAAAAARIGTYRHNVLHGDAFWLLHKEDPNRRGATVLYLNPPYGLDKEHRRLEERWLQRFTAMLRTDGALIFLVPGYALVDSAVTLATWYSDVRVYRLDAEHFAAYKQVVLIARKRGAPLPTPDASIVAQLAAPIDSLPILADAAADSERNALLVEAVEDGGFNGLHVARFDLSGLLKQHRTWVASRAGNRLAPLDKVEPVESFTSVCLRTYNAAVPPRASHIAAGIAAGVFNGVRIVSTTPGLPPLYIKGAFSRDFETVERRYNSDGEETALIQHQKPRLNITVLDTSVSPPAYRTLRSETTITESTRLDDAFTIGDLLHHYGESLLAVLMQRCPTLYSYSTPLREYDSPRALFSAQSHAVAACLRLLKQPDRAAFLLGEIGSGKSTVSLVSAATHGAKRILIVAPPHLLHSWRDQVSAVLPGASVYELSSPSDLDKIAAEHPNRLAIGIVSRETAKLGHAYEGLTRCSTCGTSVNLKLPAPKAGVDAAEVRAEAEGIAREAAARLRKRCGNVTHAPANRAARAVAALCTALHATFPDDQTIRALVPPKLRESMDRLVLTGEKHPYSEAAMLPLIAELSELACHTYSGKGLDAANGHASVNAALLATIMCCEDVDRAARIALDRLVPHALSIDAHRATGSYNARYQFLALVQSILLVMEHGTEIDAYAQRLGGPAIDPANAVESPTPDLSPDDPETAVPTSGYSYYESGFSRWGSYRKFAEFLMSGEMTQPHNVHNELLNFVDGELCLRGVAPRTNSMARLALTRLLEVGRWRKSEPCREVLYTAVPQPRRFPLARYIVKQRPHLFDFLIVDEAHEYANQDSAQSQSVQQLYGLRLPTLILTGSVANGYASSLFVPLWYLSAAFRVEFKRGDIDKFVKRYGYLKRVIDLASGQVKEHGAMSMRKEATRVSGQIPGVMPELVLRHLLPLAATIHLEDIEGESLGDGKIRLPQCEEIVIRVPLSQAQSSACIRLRNKLIEQIKRDRFTARRGKLFGQLAELPSLPDRFTVDTGSDGGPDVPGDGTFSIRYPHPDNELVISAQCLPADTVLPKEAKLIELCLSERAAGRAVMVFPWHIALMPRLARLLRDRGLRVAELYSTKVGSKKRQAWIDKNVVGAGVDVLIVNPVAVQTGLNNLVYFSTVIWYENPACNPNVRRQARGRVKRIGQPEWIVKSITLIYEGEGSLQGAAHTLLLHKVGIGEAVDGLDPTAALQAAGVGDTDSSLAQGIGAALYKMITQGKA